MAQDTTIPVQGATDATVPEKTFTQAELDGIIGDRLSRERAKYADYEDMKAKASKYDEFEEAKKSELQKVQEKNSELETKLNEMIKAQELRTIKERVSNATGVPISLLSSSTEEECTAQAQAILQFAGTSKATYLTVKDGGEGTPPSAITKADILAIKDEKARLKAIQEHIDLF